MQLNTLFFYKSILFTGYLLTLIGCLMFFSGLIGIYPFQMFDIGLSSGIRVIAGVAVFGCLISAVALFLFDPHDHLSQS